MAVTFPALVYKGGGPYLAPGGYYDYKQVADQTAYDAALAAGWKASLSEVVTNPYGMLPDPTRTAPGTILSQDGVEYICDGVNWDALSIKDYTDATLPDPASLPVGLVINVDGEVAQKTASGLRPVGLPQVNGTVGRSRLLSYAGASASGGITIVNQQASKKKYIGLYLGYENYTLSPYTLTAVSSGPTPTHLSDGTNATIVNVLSYFPSAVVPAASGTGNDIVPGMLLSGFIPQAAVARTDEPEGAYLHQIRTYCVAAWSGGQVAGGDIGTWNAWAGNQGLKLGARLPTGDQTLVFNASNAPTEAGTWIAPSFVVFVYEDQTASLVSIGDSLTKGHLATINGLSWPFIAARDASTDAREVLSFNHAWTGQKHAASIAIGKALIAAGVRPTVMTFFGWSPNDAAIGSSAHTQAIFDAGFARAVDMVEHCRANGVIPVVCTSPAVNGLDASENSRRIHNNGRLRTLLPPTQVFDFDAVITSPTNSRIINPIYDVGDGLHYNDDGYTAEGVYAATKLALLVGA